MSTEEKEMLTKDLRELIAFCTPEKESMRLLRIAGPTWRHHAAGKASAYKEVVEQLGKLAEKLGIDSADLK